MEHITVEAKVICPTHQQIIGYMEARHWHLVARRKRNKGPIYSRWQKESQHYFIDLHESPEISDYCLRQKDAIALLADYDGWVDEYSLVGQLLRGGIIGEDFQSLQPDKTEVYFSDRGATNNSSGERSEGFWQALDTHDAP